jgi:hypothetical protein
MCHFFIGPCITFLLVHMARPQYPACLSFTRPRVTMMYVHMSAFYWATCHALSYPCAFFYPTTWQDGFVPHIWFVLAHVSYPDTYMCHSLVCPRVKLLFNDMGCVESTTCTPIITLKNNFRSILLHKNDYMHNYIELGSNNSSSTQQ